jgi:hypothetical protein
LGMFEYLNSFSDVYNDFSVDVKEIRRIYTDPSISFQFIYLKDMRFQNMVSMKPFLCLRNSRDVTSGFFKIFNEMAHSSGGITEIASTVDYSIKKAVKAAENYYLLYYTPENYKSYGSYREIKVVVSGNKYNVRHRSGYFAD